MNFREFPGKEPLSTAAPDTTDVESNKRLIRELGQQGAFENPQRNQLREKALSDLEDLVSEWALELCNRKKAEIIVNRKQACQIIPFGSYCLGVHTEESDVDVLFVFPKHVLRQDFFNEIPSKLLACEQVEKSTLLTVRFAAIWSM